jgi:TRAP transporter TAXI family solute receptor
MAFTFRFRRGLAPLLVAAAIAAAPVSSQEVPAAPLFFTLGSGDIGGNYFAVARAVCREINRAYPGEIRCSPEATPGSVYNLAGLKARELDFAIVQSDWLQAAREGSETFSTLGPMSDLRGVAALYREAITILVAPGQTITSAASLDGARVDIGVPGSGRRATLDRVLRAMNLDLATFALVSELPASTAVEELCAGRLDAVLLIVGHPDAVTGRAIAECGAGLLPLAGSPAGDAIAGLGDYAPMTIGKDAYPSLEGPVETYGVTAALVTRGIAPAAEVEALVAALRDRHEALSRIVPLLSRMDLADVWPETMPVPAHPGVALAP